VRGYDAQTRSRRAGAATLFSKAQTLCTAVSPERGCGGTGKCSELSTTGALAARTIRLLRRGLFSCEDMVLERDRDAWVRHCCSAGHRLCAQLRRQIAAAAAQAIAELSTTGALAARTIRLLRRGLFSCCPVVPMRDRDAWAQLRCLAGRLLCAQLPLNSQVWRRWESLS